MSNTAEKAKLNEPDKIYEQDKINGSDKFDEIIRMAIKARETAYAPYSGFRVGAAVLTGTGKTFSGCNVENASFGATCCAERTAIFKAVSEGENSITAIAVASDSETNTYPCGICRQVIAEFASKDCRILCCRADGTYNMYTMREILPFAFTGESLKNGG